MRPNNIIFILLLISLYLVPNSLSAQEINAKVQILTPAIQITNQGLFDNMKKSIENFINNRKWTTDNFKLDEKIEMSIVITISNQVNQSEFEGDIQFVSSRPVFNSNYNSTLLRINDKKFDFTYREFEPLEYLEGSFTSNLTSVLAFYVYLSLGMDYDSFSLYGGTNYLSKALDIANSAQSSSSSGWSTQEKGQSNRYWLAFYLLDGRFKPMRQMTYDYHRKGLDYFTEDMGKGRATILNSLKLLTEVHRNLPNSYALTVIMDSKRLEIIDIFSKATSDEKKELMKIIEVIDIANSSKYRTKLIN